MAYADALAHALGGRLVVLHVNRASRFDPYDLVAEGYHSQKLDRQTDTMAVLTTLAAGLHSPATREVTTDLLPTVAQDVAARYRPVLIVLGQPDPAYPATSELPNACSELLRAGDPLLALPADITARPVGPPRRILLAAALEPFGLTPPARHLCPLLALPGTQLVVAHVSGDGEDAEGCALAQRAVQGQRAGDQSAHP